MKCPVDGTTLMMSERQGIEIDYCPDCRGVWLDRGELDRLLDRADREDRGDREVRDERDARADRHGEPKRKKKRGSFLSDIFELGG
jgi:Zn-finger nucleic acid-binding protein